MASFVSNVKYIIRLHENDEGITSVRLPSTWERMDFDWDSCIYFIPSSSSGRHHEQQQQRRGDPNFCRITRALRRNTRVSEFEVALMEDCCNEREFQSLITLFQTNTSIETLTLIHPTPNYFSRLLESLSSSLPSLKLLSLVLKTMTPQHAQAISLFYQKLKQFQRFPPRLRLRIRNLSSSSLQQIQQQPSRQLPWFASEQIINQQQQQPPLGSCLSSLTNLIELDLNISSSSSSSGSFTTTTMTPRHGLGQNSIYYFKHFMDHNFSKMTSLQALHIHVSPYVEKRWIRALNAGILHHGKLQHLTLHWRREGEGSNHHRHHHHHQDAAATHLPSSSAALFHLLIPAISILESIQFNLSGIGQHAPLSSLYNIFLSKPPKLKHVGIRLRQFVAHLQCQESDAMVGLLQRIQHCGSTLESLDFDFDFQMSRTTYMAFSQLVHAHCPKLTHFSYRHDYLHSAKQQQQQDWGDDDHRRRPMFSTLRTTRSFSTMMFYSMHSSIGASNEDDHDTSVAGRPICTVDSLHNDIQYACLLRRLRIQDILKGDVAGPSLWPLVMAKLSDNHNHDKDDQDKKKKKKKNKRNNNNDDVVGRNNNNTWTMNHRNITTAGRRPFFHTEHESILAHDKQQEQERQNRLSALYFWIREANGVLIMDPSRLVDSNLHQEKEQEEKVKPIRHLFSSKRWSRRQRKEEEDDKQEMNNDTSSTSSSSSSSSSRVGPLQIYRDARAMIRCCRMKSFQHF